MQDCSIENITVNDCKSDFILSEEDFWLDLNVFSNCSTENISMKLDEVPEFMCKFNLVEENSSYF